MERCFIKRDAIDECEATCSVDHFLDQKRLHNRCTLYKLYIDEYWPSLHKKREYLPIIRSISFIFHCYICNCIYNFKNFLCVDSKTVFFTFHHRQTFVGIQIWLACSSWENHTNIITFWTGICNLYKNWIRCIYKVVYIFSYIFL